MQYVEREEQALPPPEQQVIEHRTARVIDAGNLAIDDGLDAQVLADPLRKVCKVAERVAVARDEIALAVLNVDERPESVGSSARRCNRRSRTVRISGKAGWNQALQMVYSWTIL